MFALLFLPQRGEENVKDPLSGLHVLRDRFSGFYLPNVFFHFLPGKIELNNSKCKQSCVLYRPLYINNILLFWSIINAYTYR